MPPKDPNPAPISKVKLHPYRDAAKHTFECGCPNPNVISRTRLAQFDWEYGNLFREGDIQKVFRCRNCEKIEVFIEYETTKQKEDKP